MHFTLFQTAERFAEHEAAEDVEGGVVEPVLDVDSCSFVLGASSCALFSQPCDQYIHQLCDYTLLLP